MRRFRRFVSDAFRAVFCCFDDRRQRRDFRRARRLFRAASPLVDFDVCAADFSVSRAGAAVSGAVVRVANRDFFRERAVATRKQYRDLGARRRFRFRCGVGVAYQAVVEKGRGEKVGCEYSRRHNDQAHPPPEAQRPKRGTSEGNEAVGGRVQRLVRPLLPRCT